MSRTPEELAQLRKQNYLGRVLQAIAEEAHEASAPDCPMDEMVSSLSHILMAVSEYRSRRPVDLLSKVERVCRLCGCTEDRACLDEGDLPCGWVGNEDLCTACT